MMPWVGAWPSASNRHNCSPATRWILPSPSTTTTTLTSADWNSPYAISKPCVRSPHKLRTENGPPAAVFQVGPSQSSRLQNQLRSRLVTAVSHHPLLNSRREQEVCDAQ